MAQRNKATTTLDFSGMPGITHYNRDDFQADPQFWAISEDSMGVLYFGNNDGGLVFDRERWHTINLPNNSAIRSLTCDEKGRIFAGGYNELGLIKKDTYGRYYYQSLLDSLQLADKNLENLWQVNALQGTVIFRCFKSLIAIKDNKVTELPSSSSFLNSYLVNDQYFVYDKELGLLSLDLTTMQFEQLFPASLFGKEGFISLLPTSSNDRLLAVCRSGKIYKLDVKQKTVNIWKEKLFQKGTKDLVISAIRSRNGLYYLGTLSSRIISMNEAGQVFANEENFERLQDKTVLNLFQTSKGNIWVLLNNGLECIDVNSPVTTLFGNASIYDVLLENGKMYLATNQGVFFTRLDQKQLSITSSDFQKVEGLEGQAWSLRAVAGDILVAHDRGLFIIDEMKSRRIGQIEGIWKVIPVEGNNHLYLASSYNGIHLIEQVKTGEWRTVHKIAGFEESSRDILAGDSPGTYWVCHGYKGVYRIKLDEQLNRLTSLEHFNTKNGLPSRFNINVARWEGETVFTTNQGIYHFDKSTNQFVPYGPLNAVLDTTLNTRQLFQFESKTWFVQDDEAGYFNTAGKRPVLQKDFFLQFKGTFNRGMECIVPLSEKRVLFGTNTGLYLIDIPQGNVKQSARTYITSARYLVNQQENWLPLVPDESASQLPHNTSSLRFEFSAPGIDDESGIQYSYQLDDVDNGWSAWKSDSFKEYNHLRPGQYTFKVRCRSLLGVNGDEAVYTFEILPVWYQTTWAWIIYLILAILFIALLTYWISRKITYENNKARKEEQKARKLLELEIRQMKLQSEKEKIGREKELLEEDIIYKSKELANYTMLLVKKREVFTELQDELKELRKVVKNEASGVKVRELNKKLSQHMADEEYLQVFETNFSKVHQDFFSKLQALFPDLSKRELQLCAFVKMNLTNKDIAPLLNISVRGVETARYRLRKKLNLEHEHNLVEFLMELTTDEHKEVNNPHD